MGDTKGEKDAKAKGAGYGKSTMIIRATLGNNAPGGFRRGEEARRSTMDTILNDGTQDAVRAA
jgi:hypothetical protein